MATQTNKMWALTRDTTGEVMERDLELKKPVKEFDCIVEVYRSAENRRGSWGKADTGFKQNFGFDRYNEATDGKGLGAKNTFKTFTINKREEGSVSSYCYYIPWLCIWPPEDKLAGIPELSNHTPVTEATLFCKIDKGADKEKYNGKLLFIPDSESIEVEGKGADAPYELEAEVKDEFSIKISCTGIIEKDAKIEIRETDKEGARVGQINVIANNKIHLGKVHFVPIQDEPREITSERRLKKRKENKELFTKKIKKVLTYINTQAFNQSLIYLTATASDIISFPDDIIDRGSTSKYSDSVSEAYFDGILTKVNTNSGTNEQGIQQIEEAEKALDKAIKAYYNQIKNKNNRTCKENMEDVENQTVQDYKTRYQEYINLHSREVREGGHEREEGKIYVFVDMSRSTLNVSGFEFSGYAVVGGNNAYLFKKPLSNDDYGVFAHEIAHVLGLGHIFELGKEALTKGMDKEIEELEDKERKQNELLLKEEKKLKKQGGKTNKALSEKELEKKIKNDPKIIEMKENYGDYYNNLTKLTGNKEGYRTKLNREGKDYYDVISQNFSNLEQSIISEANVSKIIKESNIPMASRTIDYQKQIQKKEDKKNTTLKKVVEQNMSNSLENFMDYDSYVVESTIAGQKESKSKKNDDFSYRNFCKWQWDKMKKSEFLDKKSLL